MTEVFIHGLESSGQGAKGTFFRQHRPQMLIDDYHGSLHERMEKLEENLRGKDRLVLVGSSYGGLMAAIYACRHPQRVKKLVLLAPALHLSEFSPYRGDRLFMPTVIYHGGKDNVVPLGTVKSIAIEMFPHLDYRVVDDDHALNRVFPTLPWDELLNT